MRGWLRWVATVIASAATQSRGLALSVLSVALDCFAALAMTAAVAAMGLWFGLLVLQHETADAECYGAGQK